MGDKKDEDLYRNFSRKDLQGLCKKYGLPANKSSSEMATSLILYLERRNLASTTICKETRIDPNTSSTASELQSGDQINSDDDGRKDCFRNNSGSGRCSNPQDMQQSTLQNFTSGVTSNKACRNAQNLPQLQQRDSDGGACLPENVISSVVNSSTEVSSPSFQFNVSCDDGIQLFVDLNSSPSEWVESMKCGVHIHHDAYNNKSQSFHQELEGICCPKQMKGSLIHHVDSDLEINDGQVEDRSYPISEMNEGCREPMESNGDVSLSASAPGPSINSADRLEHSLGDQVVLSCRHESCAERHNVCSTKSCRGDGETKAIDLGVNEVTQIQSPCNFVVKTSLHGVKCFGMSENENLRPAIQNCQNSFLQRTLSPVNPIAEISGNSASITVEVQECAVAPQCKAIRSDISMDLRERTQIFETGQGGLINSVPFNQDASQIPSLDVSVQSSGISCFPHMHNGSEGLSDRNHSLGKEFIISTTLRECNHGPVVAQTLSKPDHEPVLVGVPLTSIPHKKPPSSPSMKVGSLDLDNMTHTTETEMGGLVCSNEFVQAAIGTKASLPIEWRKELLISDHISHGCPDMVVLKQNSEMNHDLLINSNKLDGENQPICFAEKSESRKTANGREGSDVRCLNFRDTMAKTCPGFDDSESNEGLKRRRHFDNAEDHHQPDAKILKSQKQFSGEIHASRESVLLYSKCLSQ
ncbi:hypothetical protein Ancab_008336 [Ancistrocladus abbreviatus]